MEELIRILNDIDIEASEIVPENLNSVEAMWKMITRLQEN